MTLQDAIKRANELQDKVGTITPENNLPIEAIIPAPTDSKLFTPFVNEVKWQLLHIDRSKVDFGQINQSIGAKDFSVYSLHEGTLHSNLIQMSGNILFKKLA